MAVTEALAHGLPVIAAAVGGLPEALGSTTDGTRPGQLVPPGDPAALAAALGDWLGDERHRHRLRSAARQRRPTLRGWDQTTQEIANALTAGGHRFESGPPDRSCLRIRCAVVLILIGRLVRPDADLAVCRAGKTSGSGRVQLAGRPAASCWSSRPDHRGIRGRLCGTLPMTRPLTPAGRPGCCCVTPHPLAVAWPASTAIQAVPAAAATSAVRRNDAARSPQPCPGRAGRAAA